MPKEEMRRTEQRERPLDETPPRRPAPSGHRLRRQDRRLPL